MKLIGGYLSPYVRRVAVTLHVLGIPFEQVSIRVFESPEAVRPHNPLVRIPTLLLDDGEALLESWAILDAIDEMAGPERALTPASGPERRRVMKLAALGVGSMEKAQWAYYEPRFHPPEKVHEPWVTHNDAQVLGGLGYLDGIAARAGDGKWLAGTPSISQADVSAAVAYTFAERVRPALDLPSEVPALARFAARCEGTEAFASAALPD